MFSPLTSIVTADNMPQRMKRSHSYLVILQTNLTFLLPVTGEGGGGKWDKKFDIEDITWPRGDTKFLFEC